jgi:hypothetical protein
MSSPVEREAVIRRRVAEEAELPFDLSAGPSSAHGWCASDSSCSALGCLGSVVSQRDHRIYSSGPARGDIARRERYERQQAHNSGHGDWIMRADAE